MKGLVGLAVVLLFAVVANVNAQSGSQLGYPGRCGPICRMACPNGFVMDTKGCPICKCRPFRPPIRPPIRPPRDCGPVCMIFCPHGNVPDHRGCPTCRCREGPSLSLRCPRGSTTVVPRRSCSRYQIFGRNECGRRGAFCHTAGGSRRGVCCRRRRIAPRPWPRPGPFPRPVPGYARRDRD